MNNAVTEQCGGGAQDAAVIPFNGADMFSYILCIVYQGRDIYCVQSIMEKVKAGMKSSITYCNSQN